VSFEPTYTPTPSITGEYGEQVYDLLNGLQPQLGFMPDWVFRGPVEDLPDRVQDAMIQVITLAMSNVERHAHASGAVVEIRVSVDSTQLIISDNGTGAGTDPHGHNIDVMNNLAGQFGGDLEWGSPPGGGTQLTWSVPQTAQAD
jgi:nitrate/nitrite-specific signal transduction histidine kinase